MLTNLKVLISGGGIAGSAAAYWLTKAGARVTVVERSSVIRSGQNVDIRGLGVNVIQRMGLEEKVREKTTKEEGMRLVDANNRSWAEFPVTGDKSFTAEIEITRGDLAQLLYDTSKDKAEYIFKEHISGIQENDDGVRVNFVNGTPSRNFDILIGADGQSSTTRGIVFGDEAKDCIKSLGLWSAWFAMPWSESDGEWARWYTPPRSRSVVARPDHHKFTRVTMSVMSAAEKMTPALESGREAQKDLIQQLFGDAGWETPRLLKGMHEAEDFYMQLIAQVKMPTWSKGRTVLVGDAAWTVSPLAGIGTTLGLVGAYVLVGELVSHKSDYRAAFKAFEERMRPWITKAQKLPPGTPGIAHPYSQWGVRTFYSVLWILSRLRLERLLISPQEKVIDLPDYEM